MRDNFIRCAAVSPDVTVADPLANELSIKAYMDEAAKTETEDKVSENTGDGPKIPADESEHITDEQAEDECTARTHNEYRSVTDENQHIKQQTKPTHKKTYKKRSKKTHKKQFKDKSDKIKNYTFA